MRTILYVTLFALLIAAGPASAWTLGSGTELEQPPTTIILGHDIDVATDAYFIGNTFYIAPFGFEFRHSTPHIWTLQNWSAPLNVTFVGNATEDASILFTNFQGIYQVEGLFGYPTFLIPGPSFELILPAGTTNFTIRLASLAGASPIDLRTSAAWNPQQDTVFVVSSLLDNFGNAWSTMGMTTTILRPNGSTFGTFNMTETSVPGVYSANVSVPTSEPVGPWTVTSNLGTAVDSFAIVKQGAPVTEDSTLNLDFAFINALPWLWLGLMLLMLTWEWFFAAFVALLAFGNSFLPTPRWINAASFMLFGIAAILEYVMRKWPQEVRAMMGGGERR